MVKLLSVLNFIHTVGATTCVQVSDAGEGHAEAILAGEAGPVLLVECF